MINVAVYLRCIISWRDIYIDVLNMGFYEDVLYDDIYYMFFFLFLFEGDINKKISKKKCEAKKTKEMDSEAF